jgi:hypothetical protein
VDHKSAPTAATISDGVGPAITLWAGAQAVHRAHRTGSLMRVLPVVLAGAIVGTGVTAFIMQSRGDGSASDPNRASIARPDPAEVKRRGATDSSRAGDAAPAAGQRNGLDGVFRTSSKAQSAMAFLLMMLVVWSAPGCPYDKLPVLVDADRLHCESDGQCTPLVCDVSGAMTCVQCTVNEASVCVATTPVCVNNQCQKCTAHAQCAASNVCLPDGTCADEAQIAYVQAGGTGTTCTKFAPCGTLDVGLTTNMPFVKINSGAVADIKTTSIDGKAVMVLAEPGARLERVNVGVILEVRNNADVKIFDLEVAGATGSGNAAIFIASGAPILTLTRVKIDDSQGPGISAIAGTLTMTQSTVSRNTGGGISISGAQFDLVGNVFFSNGSGMSAVGAVSISTSQSTTNRLEFNSFSKNLVQDGVGSAIQCNAGAFTARNNIMSGSGTLTNLEQVNGSCAHAYSIVRPGMLPAGVGNRADDPLFKNTTTGDLHILPGSPAAGAADPGSDLTGVVAHDIDGDVRMNPADIGADEIP